MIKHYDNYKSSGISWIGNVPSHWKAFRNKSILIEQKETVGNNPKELLSLSIKGVLKRDVESGKGKFPKDFNTYKIVHKNDLIFCLFDVDETPRTVGLSEYEGMITGAYDVFSPIKINPRFIYYYYVAVDNCKRLRPLYKGLRKVVPLPTFMSQKIYAPNDDEQQAIVNFLDKKVSEINSFMLEKEKEIELLKEWLNTRIANFTTKGLSKEVVMKDSNFSWIGKIPKHWEMRRAKYMFNKEKREPKENDEIITCFRDGQVTLRKNRRTTGFTNSLTEVGYQGIKKGDLVIHQMDAFAGAIGVSDSDGKGTSVYHCCTPKGNYSPSYYSYLIRVMARRGFIQSLYRGIRERSSDFSFKVFGEQYLAVPPLEEQIGIVEKIEDINLKVNNLTANIKAEIDLLKEYKQTLINDVITGKIKVIQ